MASVPSENTWSSSGGSLSIPLSSSYVSKSGKLALLDVFVWKWNKYVPGDTASLCAANPSVFVPEQSSRQPDETCGRYQWSLGADAKMEPSTVHARGMPQRFRVTNSLIELLREKKEINAPNAFALNFPKIVYISVTHHFGTSSAESLRR
jgi:hypothetical protein